MTIATTKVKTGRKPYRPTIETELGKEIRCSKCGEFWPADTEFFFNSGGTLHSWCKACYQTKQKNEPAKQGTGA